MPLETFVLIALLGKEVLDMSFEGWIDELTFTASKPGVGMVVAVKKLKPEGFQGHKEWLVHSSTYLNPFFSHCIFSLSVDN